MYSSVGAGFSHAGTLNLQVASGLPLLQMSGGQRYMVSSYYALFLFYLLSTLGYCSDKLCTACTSSAVHLPRYSKLVHIVVFLHTAAC